MELVNKANDDLISAKYSLIEAERIASSIEEKTYLIAVRNRVQDGIREILSAFFPETPFDEQGWLKRRTGKDVEHDQRMQKIIADAVATGAYDDSEGKPTAGKCCNFERSDEGVAKTWKDR